LGGRFGQPEAFVFAWWLLISTTLTTTKTTKLGREIKGELEMVVKLSSAYCSTHKESNQTGTETPCVKDRGEQLRGLDVVGADRAAAIAASIDYAGAGDIARFIAPLRTFAPGSLGRPRRKPIKRALIEHLTPEQRERVRKLDQAMRSACLVLRRERTPRPVERLAMAWQYTRVNPFTDYVDPTVRTRPALPSGVEVDRAGLVFEILFALKVEDEFAAYLVVAVALGVRWKTISMMDPQGRSRTRLNVARDNALLRMLELAAERRLDLF
jgi:hypothetical protein